jgi:3-mercaptopyruvate sulfurtransferase SseA
MKHGYTDVHALLGGWKAWVNAGYPIEPASLSAAV